MTDEERRQQNWVELRAECTEQGIFDLIANTVKRDVERFNKLSPQRRRNRTFKIEQNELEIVNVGQVDDSGEWIRGVMGINIKTSGATIRVWRHRDCLFAVEQEWNEETLACDLKVDGKCYSVWQISQKAIGDLLFGYV